VRNFLSKFWGVSPWMLELIMLLSAALGKVPDLVVVGLLLVVNALVSTLQERRAAGVVEALRRRLRVSARVLRDGAWCAVPARELVPGDAVRLRPGDVVPADLRLLEGRVAVDASTLTGESGDVDHSAGQVLACGSLVRRGECTATVAAIGAATALGRTTELVRKARPKLHIDAVIARLVRWLLALVGALIALMAALALARGQGLLELAPLGLVLLLSAVPVALPVMFTVSLAAGSKQLAESGVLVTRLGASEDAATMDVLCVDKTGTITLNHMAVVEVVPLAGATDAEVLLAALGASQESDQDPIDLALGAAARQRGLAAGQEGRQQSFRPFDAATRCTEAVVMVEGRGYRVAKGALTALAGLCALPAVALDALQARAAAFAVSGCRTLAVARGPAAGSLQIVGLVALRDEARPDARALVDELRGLGISVKVLTGDELSIAAQIGGEVGLPAIRGMDAFRAALDRKGAEGARFLEGIDGLAGVYPEDKFAVIQGLQAGGHVTGMTGDGVNDAPALRQAEVGIAVSSATDAAKGAASVVLNEPGLTNIVDLVEQGRMVYQRVLTWIVNKITRTVLKSCFVAAAYLVTGRFALSALAMLLLTFMTDFHNIALATDRVRASRRPETWNIGGFVGVAAALGLLMVAEALLLLRFAWCRFGLAGGQGRLQSFSFLLLFYFSVFSVLSLRERRHFWETRPGTLLLAALGTDSAVATALPFVGLPGLPALPWTQVLAVFAFACLCCLGLNDAIKVALLRWRVPAAVA